MRRVEVTALDLLCTACDTAFPSLEFSGDTDQQAAGLESATSRLANRVVVGEMSAAEFADCGGLQLFAERAGCEVHEPLWVVFLIQAEGASSRAPTPPPSPRRHGR